jgi:hypothetical protein
MLLLGLGLIALFMLLSPPVAMAVWTPLIGSTDFTGIQADVLTGVAGIIAIGLCILGGSMLLRILGK